MEEYIKIISEQGVIYYPAFRFAEITTRPISNGNLVISINLASFEGQLNSIEVEKIEHKLNAKLKNVEAGVALKLEDGQISSHDFKLEKINVANGNDEDTGGLLHYITSDKAISLKNAVISFKEVNEELYTLWYGEITDRKSNSIIQIHAVAKITSIKRFRSIEEIRLNARNIVGRNTRYNQIISKMKGIQPEGIILPSIKVIDRAFRYNDSIVAWSKIDETIEIEEIKAPYL